MNGIRNFFLLLISVGLASCAGYPRPDQAPPRKIYRPTAPPAAEPRAANPPPEVYVPPAPKVHEVPAPPTPPAVIALLDAAENEKQEGQLDAAVATLERAIRIQPTNARLWHELAELRLEQYKPRLALDLARKSNTLASGDRALKRENWRLIAEAQRLLGDLEGAAEALKQAE
ncbi:MAG: tetratricopeptide repeat protein [Gammaproteobacteria bacterium]